MCRPVSVCSANSRHSYAFPRIYGIVNDGKKSYDSGKDGQGQEAGSCSVRPPSAALAPRAGGKRQRKANATPRRLWDEQIDFRRTDVTAKARITYFKGQFTEVAIHHDKWDEWTTCFTIPALELPSNPFLGFTAHTGDVHGTPAFRFWAAGLWKGADDCGACADAHDIISITTSSAFSCPLAYYWVR